MLVWKKSHDFSVEWELEHLTRRTKLALLAYVKGWAKTKDDPLNLERTKKKQSVRFDDPEKVKQL